MKKVLCFALCIMVALSSFSALAATKEVGAGMDTDWYNVYIQGQAEQAMEGVTILLIDSQGKVGYISELATDKDGNYETKFKFDKKIGDYQIKVRDSESAEDMTGTLKTATARQDLFGVELALMESGNDVISYITEGGAADVIAKLNNKYGNVANISVLFAGYDENNKLVAIDSKSLKIDYEDINVTKSIDFSDVKLPAETKRVKVFAWEDAINLIPLAKEDVKNTGKSLAFKNENPENTKVIGILGDSITAHGYYVFFLENYYYTKYPDSNIVILNKGISGDTARGINGRYDWDIFDADDALGLGECDEVTVMIGMNDVGYGSFDKGEVFDDYAAAYPNKLNTIKTCTDNIEKIVIECQKRGKPITLITPALYDESDRFTNRLYDGIPRYGTNWALYQVGEKVKEFGEKYNVPVLDLHKASNEYSDRIREEYPKATTVITGNDGIHPSTEGGYLFGYLYVRAQETNPVIATVEIDTANQDANVDNAVVTSLSTSANSVSYTYKPKSLPMAVVDRYNYIKNYGVDITNHMNREIIKVDGLVDGTYSIAMNGVEVTKATAKELAEGVNIAELEKNPNQVISKELYSRIYTKYEWESKLRSNIMVEQSLRSTSYRPANARDDYENFTDQDWVDLAKSVRAEYEKKVDPSKWDDNSPCYGIMNYINTGRYDNQNRIDGTKAAIDSIRKDDVKPVECKVSITKVQ